METAIPRVWECWWLEQQHQESGTGASRPIQAPLGLQPALDWHGASASPASPACSCHIPVWGEPFPPLCPASLCLLYPKAPPFVLGSEGPLRLLALLTFSLQPCICMRSRREGDGGLAPRPRRHRAAAAAACGSRGFEFLFLNFLFEMFQQSRFRFGREGRQAGWVGCCCFPGASSRQQLCSHKALDAAVVFPAKLLF